MASLTQIVPQPEQEHSRLGPARVRPGDRPHAYAKELALELGRRIKGEVRFDDGSRALYSTDGSNYRQTPIGVVIPRDVEDIVETIALCRQYEAPVLPRGGGTSLAGQCCNIAVVIDCSKYMREVLDIDPKRKRARVQPGVVLDDLRNQAEQYHLTFAPDPATHDQCTLGGMIGNNSCGVHSIMAGKTDENVEELDILTYDGVRMRAGRTSEQDLRRITLENGRQGEIYRGLIGFRGKYESLIRERFPNIPRRVSGYNLPFLLPENGFDVAKALVGSEGTLVTVLEAAVRLVDSPPGRALLVLGYPDVYHAADHVMEIREAKPIGLEGIDNYLVDNMQKKGLHLPELKFLPEGKGWLLVEFGGEDEDDARDQAQKFMKRLAKEKNAPAMKMYADKKHEKLVWEIRESALGAMAFVPGEPVTWEGWEDSAVPPEKLGKYLRDLCNLYRKYGYVGALYGHFGQGCIHTRINFDFKTAEGIAKYRRFMLDAAHLVVSYGGSLSGEHGDGQSRAELLPIMFGREMIDAFNEFKAIWDPQNKMNPGKLVYPYRIDENLRHGLDYNPPQVNTHFHFPEESGWAGAADRCVGVGKCRREQSGVMCPSYMVTHEEEHSTRGRSRMLFEMMQGDVIRDGWKSQAVFDALDLCLSCKGCKADCPVNVDMASYKAEFLSHYYEGRTRPRYAYSMGLIYWWARLASSAPHLVNLVTQTPGLNNLAKAIGGISQHRRLPKFAPQTFKEWFQRRGPRNAGSPEVILWPDTFTNHFQPRVAQAAVEVLEHAGYRVRIPGPSLCCGRPLFDYGMLDLAEKLHRDIVAALRPAIRNGTPVIGLEPSCTAAFRDEMPNLFPQDEDVRRLKEQTFLLPEFLLRRANGYEPPKLNRKALVHAHCHQHSLTKMRPDQEFYKRMGLDALLLDSGCCGMAGSFGYEAQKYDISMKCGERVLLPAIRNAHRDTILIADGFSCRSQIEDATSRRGLHIAQVLQMALHEGERGPRGAYPERGYLKAEVIGGESALNGKLTLALGAGAVAAAAWYLMARRNRRDAEDAEMRREEL